MITRTRLKSTGSDITSKLDRVYNTISPRKKFERYSKAECNASKSLAAVVRGMARSNWSSGSPDIAAGGTLMLHHVYSLELRSIL